MFGSDVTTSASRVRSAIASRIVRCRRLRRSVGACDIDGFEPFFQRGHRRIGAVRVPLGSRLIGPRGQEMRRGGVGGGPSGGCGAGGGGGGGPTRGGL